MNSNTVSEILKESSGAVISEIIEITWDGGSLRYVNNTEGIEIGDEYYTPTGFSFTPPDGTGGSGTLEIDDTDGTLTYILQEKDTISVSVALIDMDEPEPFLEGPLSFDIEEASSSSDGSCRLTLSSRSKLSYGLSKLTYSTTIFPGLYG